MIENLLNFLAKYDLFFLILALNVLSNSIGTLKNILVVKYGGWVTGVVVIIDAAVYAVVLKSFSSSGISAIVAYVLGHAIGYILGTRLNKKLCLGMSDIQFYLKDYDTMMKIQKQLLDEGYSSTCQKGYLDEKNMRYSISIQTTKKQIKNLKRIFAENGYDNPTMFVREIESVHGHIASRM